MEPDGRVAGTFYLEHMSAGGAFGWMHGDETLINDCVQYVGENIAYMVQNGEYEDGEHGGMYEAWQLSGGPEMTDPLEGPTPSK